jgi:hypothetical protein
MPLSVVWGTFEDFCISLALTPLVWGVILAMVIYLKKKTLGSKWGLQKVCFSLVKGLSKMTFLHFKRMHLGSVSLAFM